MRHSNCALTALALLALSGCGSSPEAPTADAVTAEAPPTRRVYSIGQSVVPTNYKFTLASVSERSKASDNPFADSAGPGEVFVVAKFTVKNLGSSPLDTSGLPKVELLDDQGTAYAEDSLNSALVADGGLESLNDINPGVTYRSGLAWKVAKGAFDPAKWKIVVRADPAFEYRLKEPAGQQP